MLCVDCQSWNQKPSDLIKLAIDSEHPRTRERFLALYEIANGINATKFAEEIGRHHQTVQDWVHLYNNYGPGALIYRRSGGRPPFFAQKPKQQLPS